MTRGHIVLRNCFSFREEASTQGSMFAAFIATASLFQYTAASTFSCSLLVVDDYDNDDVGGATGSQCAG